MKKLCIFLALLISASVYSQDATPVEVANKLANESEASIVFVGGNSKTESYSVKQKSSYERGPNKFTLKGHYLMGKSGSLISAENWDVGLRYDYSFTEKLATYLGETLSGDRFKNIHLQYDTDAGLKYTFWKEGASDYALSELGYRLAHYDYVVGLDKTTHFARLYAEAAKSFNEKVFGKLWVEYLPNIERASKYLINFEPSINVSLTTIFTMKTGFLGNYDSEPTAPKKLDYTYTLALIAKY